MTTNAGEALSELLKTRTPLIGKWRRKLEVVLQSERLAWLVEREEGRKIRRSVKGAVGEGDAEGVETCCRSRDQSQRLEDISL